MRDGALTLRRQEQAEPKNTDAAAEPRTEALELLGLQRTAGNAAVARLLRQQRGSAVLRQPADAPPAPTDGGGPGPAGAPASPIAQLAKKAGGANGLRTMLAASPGLAQQIVAYFAAGNEDPELNQMMGAAFCPEADAARADKTKPAEEIKSGAPEKDLTDPSVPLPPDIKGDKTLDKGQMKWTLTATDHQDARVDIDFKPDESKVEAKNVSFVQTVLSKVGADRAYAGGTAADPAKNKARFEPFEEDVSKKRVDHLPLVENDPFYGAVWDQGAKKWAKERDEWEVGSSKKGVSSTHATMFDTPGVDWAREGKGDQSIEFETVPVVLETRQPLGSLTWGFKIKDDAKAPIELTGGQDADCVDTPSDDWSRTLDKFYEGKFAEILDDFDIGKADLKPDHKTKLDNIVKKMTDKPELKAQLGGAADLTGPAKVNEALSLKRAQAAQTYLVGKGIDAARLEVQSYGADWARVEEEADVSEGQNRRVQIWLH
jgi:outer membrane protein OmpA-like peptidoglycan-associated protein